MKLKVLKHNEGHGTPQVAHETQNAESFGV